MERSYSAGFEACPKNKIRRIKTMPHLKAQDTEIYYEVHGDGPPFLFCSVTGLDHQAWKFHQVREFSRDHKVIVFDYRGTGKSSKVVQKYSIKMFTDDNDRSEEHTSELQSHSDLV